LGIHRDVYVWAILLLALIAAIRRNAPPWRAPLSGLVGAYFLFCGASRVYALHTASHTPATVRLDAFPQPMNPLQWTIVRDDGTRFTGSMAAHRHVFAVPR